MTSRDRQSFAAPFDVTRTLGDVGANESLLARARALEPIIREHVDTTERDRRLARPVLHAMREAGLFRMFTPRAFGGLEADPVTVARVAEEIASFDSAAARALQASNTGSWWAGHFPATGIAELYADGPDSSCPPRLPHRIAPSRSLAAIASAAGERSPARFTIPRGSSRPASSSMASRRARRPSVPWCGPRSPYERGTDH